MLGFFRRHQKIFFYFVTAIVVVTMTFFGSMWSSRGPTKGEDPVVFRAVDGSGITQHELAQMVVFLSSDAEDKVQLGGVWGPNFLNDGVVRRDLLETGVGTMLAAAYFDSLTSDLKTRQEREKTHTPYVHAHARFLNAESVWSAYAPRLLTHYQALKQSAALPSPESFEKRVALYLQEQRFPQMALKQVLRHQESQYGWIPQDPYLFRQDLALFGYHTLEDWFGPRFLTLTAEFVINASIVAQEQGYTVSEAEAWTELRRHAEQSFAANRHSPYLDVGQPGDYIDQQLHHMAMDRGSATQCWRRVMLMRRLFEEIGNTALVDRFAFEQFSKYADQKAELEVFTLSSDLILPNYKALQAFECYLDAVAERDPSDPLALPQTFRSIAEVKERAPELVKREYTLEVAQVHRATVALRIPVKELWNTQLAAENWESIIDKFPVLAPHAAETRAERLHAIDALDRQTRRQLDAWAQQQMIAAHPEWIQEALDEVEPHEITLGLTSSGGDLPLAGISDRKLLAELLDAGTPISGYTEDDDIYSRITVRMRSENEEILTFGEAQKTGALQTTSQRLLGDPGRAQDQAADRLFASVIEAAYRHGIASEPMDTELPDTATGDYAAQHRFRSHLRQIRDTVVETGAASVWVQDEKSDALTAQWRVIPRTTTVHRRGLQAYGRGEPYDMPVGAWSNVTTEVGKAPYFFCVVDKAEGSLSDTDPIGAGQRVLASEAERCYMESLLVQLKASKSSSLAQVYPHE